MSGRTHLVDHVTGHRRMRRNRKADWTRRLVRENHLTVDDLIWPIFLVAGTGIVEPIPAMPGVNRMSIDKAVEAVKEAADLGIPAIAGAGVFKLGDAAASGEAISFGMLLTAVLTFFVALGTITVLMKLVRHMSFLPFAIYRVLLGLVLLALIYSGMPLGAVN